MKKSDLLIHTDMNESQMHFVGPKTKSQKTTHCILSYDTLIRQSYRHRKQIHDFQRVELGERFDYKEVQENFCVKEMFSIMTIVLDIQLYSHVKRAQNYIH